MTPAFLQTFNHTFHHYTINSASYLHVIRTSHQHAKPTDSRSYHFMSSSSLTVSFDGDPFRGIMSHLRDESGGNPKDTGVVLVTAPTETHEEYPLRNLLEYTDLLDKCYWNFANGDPKPGENWLQFDFKSRRISLTAYTVRSGGSSHPKSWRITGSNDGQEWTELHAVSDCKTLNGPRKTETFVLDAPTAEYRMIRYVQTDNQSPRAERKYRINLKAIEFFGTLSE